MSGIVLSASVRQNLLSLQSTAALLATTQNDLATGNKVNSALDNPTNFFTAQGLNNRATDIGNLLDGIGNGVQVLQAANTGITSLQSLVSSAQSIANQVLQSPVGYSTKSNVTSAAITGATANNLLGTLATNNAVTGTAVSNHLTSPVVITAATKLVTAANSDTLAATPADGSSFTVDGKSITFSTGQTTVTTDASGNVTIGVGAGSTLTVGSVLTAIDGITGAGTASTVNGAGQLVISTGTTQNLVIAAGGTSALGSFGLSAGTTNRQSAPAAGRDADHRRDRRRHGDLDHLRHLGQSGLDAERAQRGARGQQPAGHDRRDDRQDQHHDLERRGVFLDRHDRRHVDRFRLGLQRRRRRGSCSGGRCRARRRPRSSLVAQYNNVLAQINTTSQDASFNGVNLLNGDTLKLTFNETGKSTLSITGVTFNSAGLGLSTPGRPAPTSWTTRRPTRR